jgi:hypothetical protein
MTDKAVVETMLEKGREPMDNIVRSVKEGQSTFLKTLDEVLKDFARDKGITGLPKDEIWKQYREHYKATHEGKEAGFVYFESPRASEQGWSDDKGVPKIPTPPPPGAGPTTPGAAAGLGERPRGRVTPPSERPRATYVDDEPQEPPRGGARRRREPDVGPPEN